MAEKSSLENSFELVDGIKPYQESPTKRFSRDSRTNFNFVIKTNRRSTKHFAQHQCQNYSPFEEASQKSIKLSKEVANNPATIVSHHNGLLTPFCRKQISFMRNYKQNRPGPLQEISYDSFPTIEIDMPTKRSNDSNSFRTAYNSCYLRRLKSKQLRVREIISRKQHNSLVSAKQTTVLEPIKTEKEIPIPKPKPKFFQNIQETEINVSIRHKEDEKLLEIARKCKETRATQRVKQKDSPKKKTNNLMERLQPWNHDQDLVLF